MKWAVRAAPLLNASTLMISLSVVDSGIAVTTAWETVVSVAVALDVARELVVAAVVNSTVRTPRVVMEQT
jgi:hypothetical protein